MSYVSALDDLALHGVRMLGYASAGRIAQRYRLDAGGVEESLLDFEAFGWIRRSSFHGDQGWSMTGSGRAENERRLAVELERAGAHERVGAVHAAFLPLNRRFGQACTDWQVRPARNDPMAANDHTDGRWDERVLATLASVETSFVRLCEQLGAELARFGGYPELYAHALARVQRGGHLWLDAVDRDSLHLVWIQFHEDLLATLGLPRGADS